MSILSGILAALSFPKANLSILVWVALVPLLIEISRKKNIKGAAMSGFLFGLSFFSINLFWINTLNDYAPFFAALGFVCLVVYQSIFTALACAAIKRFANSLLMPPIIWASFEWIRSMGPFGVSAGDLGLTQAGNLQLIQIAYFIKVFGITFLIVLINNSIAKYLTKPNKLNILNMALSIALIFSVIIYGNIIIKNPASGKGITISIVQGNIPQAQKLSYKYNNEIFNIHENMTKAAIAEKSEIIIWPESVMFLYLADEPQYLSRIKALCANSHLIIGSPFNAKDGNIYNSILVFSQKGEIVFRYDKQRLVPFGEYLPFRALLYPLLKYSNFFFDDFNPGGYASLFEINSIKFGPLVCFESTFPDLAKDRTNKGADVLLTLTNDAWFKNSSAPYEHLSNAVFRAVENRKYFIQAANTGISAVIDPYGRIIAKAGIDERKVLTFKIPLP
ncbi:MAG: apolipoprotein N-acyltransferase [Candidatus Saganbacteria bacterium]|uniref:Apolipoprotein N-acyltransferase n=1 Tax=Candidatus Saganbacteria bacterium TaxID=2575572 RepID=A0A833L0N8_UNCSA|nr:MAG: apolipoprotein N-acyltransferase [Candidatus Saganbacteria bacterium]